MPTRPPEPARVPTTDIDELDVAAFRERHLLPGRPLLVRGAIADWPALERWKDPEYLAAAAGERIVPAVDPDNGSRLPVPLARFWREVFSGRRVEHGSIKATMMKNGRPGDVGDLQGDTRRVALLPGAEHLVTNVFAGVDTRSGVHYHPDTEAFLCQVVGKKRVLLFPPQDSNCLYPVPWHAPYVCFSRVGFSRTGDWPDLSDFPRLAASHPLECEVQPGDLLYIPIYWWHVVWSQGTAICATQFFRSSFRKRYLTRFGMRSNGLNRVGGMRLRLGMWRRSLRRGA